MSEGGGMRTEKKSNISYGTGDICILVIFEEESRLKTKRRSKKKLNSKLQKMY